MKKRRTWRAWALARCEDCGGELVMTGRDRGGADYWCPTCSRKAAAPSDRKQEAGLVERVHAGSFDAGVMVVMADDYDSLLSQLAARDEEIAGLRAENKRLEKQADSILEQADSTVVELRAKLATIISAYDNYRARGVMPAPDAYADMVLAINSARSEGGGA